MSTYVIGDIHGCFATLERLLEDIEYSRSRDTLWLTGDLVNRGPRSLEVVEWARQNADHVVTVLGNHDLHLVSCYLGLRKKRRRDSFGDVLEHADVADLVEWFLRQPLIHREGEACLVHAGILPQWSVDESASWGEKISEQLRRDPAELLTSVYAPGRDYFAAAADHDVQLQSALRALVSIRTCSEDGQLCAHYTGPPADAPDGCTPWFELRPTAESERLVFGHWAALGFYRGAGCTGLDSGCVWGGQLTALRLEDGHVVQVSRIDNE